MHQNGVHRPRHIFYSFYRLAPIVFFVTKCYHNNIQRTKFVLPAAEGGPATAGGTADQFRRRVMTMEKQKKVRRKRRTDPRILRLRLALGGAVLLLVVIVAVIVALVSCNQEPQGPATPETGTSAGAWMINDQGYYFNDQGEPIMAAVKKGIDVSKYQGQVDWEKAKATGIDFAMIRCGFGSEWNGEGSYAQDDEYWEYNADTCTALGIPFGTYLYSYATTEEQARSEADHVARLLGLKAPDHEGLADYTSKPYQLSYPVYYDLEDASITGLFPSEMAALTKAFFDQLESYGYTGEQGIYASLNWTRARLQDPAFDQWRDNFWIARFSSELGYTGPYAIWQATYTAPGADYGVQSETVDVDFVMEELMFTGITDAAGKAGEPSFTNDTYKNELWLGQKGDHCTLQTNEPSEKEGGQKLYWTSSDETVATVSKKGVVKAKGEGSCTITATLADGRNSISCTVRVGSITVPIYATGNLAGQTATDKISFADLAALKAANQDTILLDAGGSLQGTENTSLTGGMDMTSAFAAAGYQLQCFDGVDLAFGSERLLDDVVTANGPSLASNLRSTEGTPLFYRSTSWSNNRITDGMNYIVQEAGKQIGFFALSSTGNYAHAAGMTANDRVQTASEQMASLQAQGADAIVCVVGPDTGCADILEDLKTLGVNAVITANDEEIPASDSGWVCATGAGLENILCVQLTFDAAGGVTVSSSQVSASSLQAARNNLTAEQQTAYDNASATLDSLASGDASVAAQTLFNFAENTEADRTVSFGNYVASVYEALADGDRANWPEGTGDLPLTALAGGVTELEYGDITRGALLDALPAGERLVLVQTTSTAISQLIDSGTVTRTYTDSLVAYDVVDGPALLVTDTATLKTLSDQNYTILRDYGDVFWDIRMNINDVTQNFATSFVLPEAPRFGVGRNDL